VPIVKYGEMWTSAPLPTAGIPLGRDGQGGVSRAAHWDCCGQLNYIDFVDEFV